MRSIKLFSASHECHNIYFTAPSHLCPVLSPSTYQRLRWKHENRRTCAVYVAQVKVAQAYLEARGNQHHSFWCIFYLRSVGFSQAWLCLSASAETTLELSIANVAIPRIRITDVKLSDPSACQAIMTF